MRADSALETPILAPVTTPTGHPFRRALSSLLRQAAAGTRFLTLLFVGLAFLSLILAALAVYAVLHGFAVRQRGNVALRMAIGATAQDVRRWMLAKVLSRAAGGIGLASCCPIRSVASSRSICSNTDPNSLAPRLAAVLMVGVVLAASWRPAQDAARTPPVAILKEA